MLYQSENWIIWLGMLLSLSLYQSFFIFFMWLCFICLETKRQSWIEVQGSVGYTGFLLDFDGVEFWGVFFFYFLIFLLYEREREREVFFKGDGNASWFFIFWISWFVSLYFLFGFDMWDWDFDFSGWGQCCSLFYFQL